MEDSGSEAGILTFEQLAKLREQTEAIAGFLRNRLQSYLETLRPLFSPQRLLGKYVDRKEDVSGSEKAAAQVLEKFNEVCGYPFSLTPELDDDILAGIDSGGDELVLCEVLGGCPTPFRPSLSSAPGQMPWVGGASLHHPQRLPALISSGGQPHPYGHAVFRRLEFCRTDRC